MYSCDQAGITGQTLYQLGDKINLLDIEHCNPQTIENANQVYGVTERDGVVKFYHPPAINGGRRYHKTRKAKGRRKTTRRK
jgi:hypothetical protein